MKSSLRLAIVAVLAFCAVSVTVFAADEMEGDARDHARDRVRDIKREWDDISKAEKFRYLRELSRYPDRKVGNFLEDVMTEEDEDDDVASRAAWALARHGDPDDFDELEKAYKRADTPERRAAIARWMGLFGEEEALKDLKKIAADKDASSETAVYALKDIDTEAAWNAIEDVAIAGDNPAARKTAMGLMLQRGDERGVETLDRAADLQDAAAAAHFAIGNDLETKALRVVLDYAKKGSRMRAGKRPHYFGSLLARLTKQESHELVVKQAGALSNTYDAEIGWWLISVNRAGADFKAASRWLGDDDVDDILNGLRYLQRLPEPLEGDGLKLANEKIAPLLDHDNDDVVAHALFTAISTGSCTVKMKEVVGAWIDDEKPFRRAAALLASARAKLTKHGDRASELLQDEAWFVQSAAIEALLHLRPQGCAIDALKLAEETGSGRLFSEALVLLADLTGVDHGDDLKAWHEWFASNENYATAGRKLDTVRGVPHTIKKDRSAAMFYGLEINSTNVQFALDRSVSMVNPVRREPTRPGFAERKKDILKRRPEVGRMMREGFLPRFYVAAGELSAALDGMNQDAMFGITLFNHEMTHHERTQNSIDNRKDAVNWMLSTDIQGGTNIKAALLEIIEKGEADTILLLSDGEPMSLSILEMIARANAVKRVNIMVVSIHKELYHRHYLDALATRHYGEIVDAEPEE